MSIKVQDFGEIGYGGLVTLTSWWDNQRIDQGKIASKDVFKKASFYTYLGIGIVATLMSVFGWMRRFEPWTEKVSTGFMYDLPRFAYEMSKTLTAGRGRGSESAAVKEAQRIIAQQRDTKQLTQGQGTSRSYQPEFKESHAW
jgi:hypothetical protein